nr:hypothetical protein [Tanacetum cinerariifolium]
MLELFEVCRLKEFYCMHNHVDDLLESALNSKLLSINLRSQRLDKKKQEVKVIVEQPTERGTQSDNVIESGVKNLVQIPREYEVIFDNEKINSDEIDPHYFNAESDLIEPLSNHDTFDYLEEISGELTPTSIANKERIKRGHEEYIIGDSDSLREEIDIFTGTDDLIPPGSESDDDDLEGDIHFLEELLDNDSISLLKNQSYNFDHHDDPSFPRPPPEPPDVEVFFDFELDSGKLISVVKNNIDELIENECFDPWGDEIHVFENIEDDNCFPFIFVIRIFLPCLIYLEVSLLLLSIGSKDTIFDPSIST